MFKKIAVAAALAIVASSSFAAPAPKFYVGGDLGATSGDNYSNSNASIGAYFGYQFVPNFAAEVGVRRLGQVDYAYSGFKATESVDQFALSVIGSVPLNNRFDVYGRLGFNTLSYSYSDNYMGSASSSKTNLLIGVGAGFAFTPAISARAEIQRPSSTATNLSVGVSFKF